MDPPHSSSYTSFPILAVSILGILTTAILLVSYYVFVIKCCLNCHRSDLLLRLSTLPSRSRSLSTPFPSPSQPRGGLSPSAIRSIPTLRFTHSASGGGPHISSVDCAVCLTDFQHSDLLLLLPTCSHAFHIDCIDTWLQSNANCPLCRSDIIIADDPLVPIPSPLFTVPQIPDQLVIEVRDNTNTVSDQTAAVSPRPPIPSPRKPQSPRKRARKHCHVTSMGDECIDVREKDERFEVQPIRRSFSMDSSSDRQLYVSVQEILQRNPTLFREVGSGEGSSSTGSGRIRRSFFSFGHGRSLRNAAVLPVQTQL